MYHIYLNLYRLETSMRLLGGNVSVESIKPKHKRKFNARLPIGTVPMLGGEYIRESVAKNSNFTTNNIIDYVLMSGVAWKNYVKGLVKAELAKRNINYIQLAKLLKDKGIDETPQNLSNKIARGTFGAIFMLQILDSIGCTKIELINN